MCLPELAFEVVELSGALEFDEVTELCSEGLPLRVNELIAQLHCKKGRLDI